ncbi:type II toxin-antitoxin system prevent-host-death family antitoxin [Zhaonella formicivorans]|jgi:prevent-host-death family protein|uniref:type II toxin-antitoxin system prevent-host-death family antitoxin n=1 Tax=Zhaonella formicivorans TaxID=2528593 RepID=UPI0010EE86FB|nr:type II toxin-antitoxin system prevent-host-death family antitoxin [Zhaonella formicivorans]
MYKIIPSTNLRNKYNQISELARKEQKPIVLTKNGEGDLVVMSIELFEKKELEYEEKEMELEFYKQLFEDEKDIEEGKFFTGDQVSQMLSKFIKEDLPEVREKIRKQYS